MSKVTKFYTVRLTGEEITLIVAALRRLKMLGAAELAEKFLERITR